MISHPTNIARTKIVKMVTKSICTCLYLPYAAFSLDRIGAVYPELVADEDGYHIVMLTGKRAALKRTYEQAKRAIRHKLARERREVAMAALTERLRAEVEIEIDYEALKEVQVGATGLPEGP